MLFIIHKLFGSDREIKGGLVERYMRYRDRKGNIQTERERKRESRRKRDREAER